MKKEHETLADIVAEMRKVKGFSVPYAPSGYNGVWVTDLIDFVDRIKSAWKRERAEIEANALAVGGLVEAERQRVVVSKTETTTVGNAAAMRDAAESALSELDKFGQCHDARIHFSDIVHIENAKGILRAALSAPARQCDVGTEKEQNRRFDNYCRGEDCNTCPCNVMPRCYLVWAQTPYAAEEGAGK